MDSYGVASSGGKDSTFALYCAQQRGRHVTHLFHVYGVEYGRVRFHGYRPEMIEAQADALGLQAIIEPTRGEQFDEDFALALAGAKGAGLAGLIFGNLSLEDVSAYYRRHVEAAGLRYQDILWEREPRVLLEDFVELGFRAVITSVWLARLPREYLGRCIDAAFIADISNPDVS